VLYIDPASRSDYNQGGKTSFVIDGHLRILCQPKDVEALRNIIWFDRVPRTVVLFANGYRNWIDITDISAEKPDTKNQIVMQDNVDNSIPYWNGIDASFLSRRKPERAYYADGHHSITTSSHNVNGSVLAAKVSFIANLDCMASEIEYNLCQRPTLNIKPNNAGFNTRVSSGRKAAANWLIQLLKDYPGLSNGTETITIDVVAHSMGLAYAQGMIEFIRGSAIKNNIKWSGYYILAPENASAGTVNTSAWEQVWQYGSDLGQTGADPMWLQDGVAPQAAVTGIDADPAKGGRAYIPKNQGIPKGFVESHSIGNYGWIFGIQPGLPNNLSNGYVSPR